MALSGTFYGTTANASIKPKLTWVAVQDTENNWSEITVTLTYSRTNKGYTTAGNWEGSVTIGEQTFPGKKYISVTYQSDTVAMTATARVPHDDHGQLTLTVSAQGKITNPADSTLKSTQISGTATLDDIPRATQVTGTDGFIGSYVTVVLARKNRNFTHSLGYRFGTLSGWLDEAGQPAQTEQVFSQEVVNFQLPEGFYGEIPHAPSGVCTLVCNTYQGETLIGTREATLTAAADPALCAPVLQVTAKATDPTTQALTGGEDLFLRYVSAAACTVTAQARNGASLLSVEAEGTPIEGAVYEIGQVQTDKIKFTATDSRGYTGSFLLELSVLPYVPLTVNATVRRTDPTGDEAVLTVSGNCWKGSFPTGENQLQLTCSVGEQTQALTLSIRDDHTYYQEILLTGLDYRKSYPVTVAVADSAMEAQQQVTVQKGLPVFDWGEADFRFHVPVEVKSLTIDGTDLAQYIRNIIQET